MQPAITQCKQPRKFVAQKTWIKHIEEHEATKRRQKVQIMIQHVLLKSGGRFILTVLIS